MESDFRGRIFSRNDFIYDEISGDCLRICEKKNEVEAKMTNEDFFSEESLKKRKDQLLKVRCESAFESLAISRREFFRRAKLSSAYWWRLSWGIDDFPLWLKKHLFREFGDCFAFLFEKNLLKEEVEK